jgi:hypothetical protein
LDSIHSIAALQASDAKPCPCVSAAKIHPISGCCRGDPADACDPAGQEQEERCAGPDQLAAADRIEGGEGLDHRLFSGILR